MTKDYQNMSRHELRKRMRDRHLQVQIIEQKYQDSISDKMKSQLLLINSIESLIDSSLIMEDKGSSFSKLIMSCIENRLDDCFIGKRLTETRSKVIEKMQSIYGNLINLEGNAVSFFNDEIRCSHSNSVPLHINLLLLSEILPKITLHEKSFECSEALGNLEEIITDLLPFMLKYSDRYEQLLLELYELDMEEQRRDDMAEGEAHLNWLIHELGEDVFPDRD
jgi:hypothetical protein